MENLKVAILEQKKNHIFYLKNILIFIFVAVEHVFFSPCWSESIKDKKKP